MIPIQVPASAEPETPTVSEAIVRTAALSLGDEIERAKARIAREAERNAREDKAELLRDFLDVLDDLDRAVEAAGGSGQRLGSIAHGVELVRRRFLSRLADHGVHYHPALGERFDPARHEAVTAVSVADRARDGLVVAEVRKGYDIGDQVLRPARVGVARCRGF